MPFLEDTLKILIEDVDDVVRVWIDNEKNQFKEIKELRAIYENGVHGFSKGSLVNELDEGNNYIIVGTFNKVFNGTIKLKYLPFNLILKGGKTSYALSFYINNNKIWSHFKYISDYEVINHAKKEKKRFFARLSDYFGSRTEEEENAIVGLKYYHIFKIKMKNNKIYFSEVYNEDLIYKKKFHLKTFGDDMQKKISEKIMKVNKEFLCDNSQRYADNNCNEEKGKE